MPDLIQKEISFEKIIMLLSIGDGESDQIYNRFFSANQLQKKPILILQLAGFAKKYF